LVGRIEEFGEAADLRLAMNRSGVARSDSSPVGQCP
jgi:hypothetical protein